MEKDANELAIELLIKMRDEKSMQIMDDYQRIAEQKDYLQQLEKEKDAQEIILEQIYRGIKNLNGE